MFRTLALYNCRQSYY